MTNIKEEPDNSKLPQWSTDIAHKSLTAETFTTAMLDMETGINRLETALDDLDVRKMARREVTSQDGATGDLLINQFNETLNAVDNLSSYLEALVSVDSHNEQAQGLLSELDTLTVRISPFTTRLADWLVSLGVEQLATVSKEIQKHQQPLQRLADSTKHQLSEIEEKLYAELENTGSGAWGGLHSNLTSQLVGQIVLPAETVELPMATIRGLANDPNPATRQAAYISEMETWGSVAETCAAALNSIKGEANIINRRCRWKTPLEASLDENNIDNKTFTAMQAAVKDALPDFWRWMRAKGQLHGDRNGLSWWNLAAPLEQPEPITWTQGTSLIRGAFNTYSANLANIVDRACREKWIDVGPRQGKVDGAFCMPFVGDRSLVLLNWNGTLADVLDTAHELGHAYHNTQMGARTPLQKDIPMTLAETASIFCETLVMEELLKQATPETRLALLDFYLQSATHRVVDIHSRFLFETAFFQQRRRHTLGVTEISALMLKAQNEAYGDGLDQNTAHPYMWAVKSHYYDSQYYNWPYTFGFLFGLGIHAVYQADPLKFQANYDEALALSGIETPAQIGSRFGIDISDKTFWQTSLKVLQERIREYEHLVTGR